MSHYIGILLMHYVLRLCVSFWIFKKVENIRGFGVCFLEFMFPHWEPVWLYILAVRCTVCMGDDLTNLLSSAWWTGAWHLCPRGDTVRWFPICVFAFHVGVVKLFTCLCRYPGPLTKFASTPSSMHVYACGSSLGSNTKAQTRLLSTLEKRAFAFALQIWHRDKALKSWFQNSRDLRGVP